MTLLDDLQGLDLEQILNARASITLAVDDPDLAALVNGGAAQTTLGSLGTALSQVTGVIEHPEQLLDGIGGAFAGLSGSFELDGVPLEEYEEAVRRGAEILRGVLDGLGGDPFAWAQLLGVGLGDALDEIGSSAGEYVRISGEGLSAFRQLVSTVEGDLPRDPHALAEVALEALLPFETDALTTIRRNVDDLVEGAAAIALPPNRTASLVLALDAVAVAAGTGDPEAVRHALATLERVRTTTISSLETDLRYVLELVGRLRVDQALAPVVEASAALRSAERGVLEFLQALRADLVVVRTRVEELDFGPTQQLVAEFLDRVEAGAHELADPVEEQVDRLEAWIRDLLRELPLRELRGELSEKIHEVAAAVEDVNLDGPAEEARGKLREVRQAVDDFDPSDEIRAALDHARGVIHSVLDAITTALGLIKAAAEGLADEAAEIVEAVAEVLQALRDAVEEAKEAVEGLEIEVATQQVIDAIHELREQAEELLDVEELPDPLRVLIDQVVRQLGEIDLGPVVRQPVDEAFAEFTLIEDLNLSGKLEEVQQLIENVVPQHLGAALQEQVGEVIATIRKFRPEELRKAISEYLDDAAKAIEEIDLDPVIAEIRKPFQVVLDGVDEIKPSKLLAPLIEAFDELLGGIDLPSPEEAAQTTASAIGNVTNALSDAVAAPVRGLAPEGTVDFGAPPGTIPGLDVRPGDVVRMLGYVPRRLREELAALDRGPAGEAARTIDRLCGALARDLRAVQAQIWEVERRLEAGLDDALAPIAAAQVRAQLAIQARFAVEADLELEAQPADPEVVLEIDVTAEADVDVWLDAIALAGPGPTRAAIDSALEQTRAEIQRAARAAGGDARAALERTAEALERTSLGRLGGDLDGLLAALDPEPLAAEVDALVAAALRKGPELLNDLGDDLERAVRTLQRVVLDLNPGALVQRFLRVLDVLREELELLSPRKLAEELDEIHAAFRAQIEAYDPGAFAGELQGILTEVATSVREIDPSAFLTDDDLQEIGETVSAVEDAVPTEALASVGASLDDAAEALTQIDVAGLVRDIEQLKVRVQGAIDEAIDAVERELNALIDSLRFHGEAASGSISVGATVTT
ncbi:MAG TPA: hypothetical protein VGJ77_20065 [Gaiellaceae bacterium]|jgi:hypothetical protein